MSWACDRCRGRGPLVGLTPPPGGPCSLLGGVGESTRYRQFQLLVKFWLPFNGPSPQGALRLSVQNPELSRILAASLVGSGAGWWPDGTEAIRRALPSRRPPPADTHETPHGPRPVQGSPLPPVCGLAAPEHLVGLPGPQQPGGVCAEGGSEPLGPTEEGLPWEGLSCETGSCAEGTSELCPPVACPRRLWDPPTSPTTLPRGREVTLASLGNP